MEKWGGSIVSMREAYEATKIGLGPFPEEPWDAVVRRVCRCMNVARQKSAESFRRRVDHCHGMVCFLAGIDERGKCVFGTFCRIRELLQLG